MYKIKDDILHTQQGEDTLVVISVLDEQNCYYKLTGLGQKIFLGIKEGRDLAAIKQEILAEFDVTEKQVDEDTEKFLSFLVDNGIALRR